MRSSVDLPQPFGPSNPMRSPSPTTSDTPCTRWRSPTVTCTSWSVSRAIGGRWRTDAAAARNDSRPGRQPSPPPQGSLTSRAVPCGALVPHLADEVSHHRVPPMLRHLIALALTSAALAQDYYSAALDGGQEVPPVPTAG